MSANNLGIVFGPTLLRLPDGPGVASAGPVTCLLDSVHQAQLIEFLIVHHEQIFGIDDLFLATEPLPRDPSPPPTTLPTSPQPPYSQPALDALPISLASDPNPDTMPLSALEKHPETTPTEVRNLLGPQTWGEPSLHLIFSLSCLPSFLSLDIFLFHSLSPFLIYPALILKGKVRNGVVGNKGVTTG